MSHHAGADHLIGYVAHVVVRYAVARTLFHLPLGLVLVVGAIAAVLIVRRFSARRSVHRSRRG